MSAVWSQCEAQQLKEIKAVVAAANQHRSLRKAGSMHLSTPGLADDWGRI